jgi:DNA ligase-1
MKEELFGKVQLAPNKAVDFNSEYLEKGFPFLASGKLDGMRAVTLDGMFFSRSMKPLKNDIQELFSDFLLESKRAGFVFDGELYSETLTFSEIMSALSRGGADVKFHIFDVMSEAEWKYGGERPFADRVTEYHNWVNHYCQRHTECRVVAVKQFGCLHPEHLKELFGKAMSDGFEGVMLRDPAGRYKHGRGTLNEGLIYKFKEWVTVDAKIVGYKRATRMKKAYAESDRGTDELGRSHRTSAKGTREEYDGIGSVVLESSDGVQFGAGIAPECDLKIDWSNKDEFIGRWVEIKFMRHGTKDKPRFAGIVRGRDDLSDGDSIEGLKDIL